MMIKTLGRLCKQQRGVLAAVWATRPNLKDGAAKAGGEQRSG